MKIQEKFPRQKLLVEGNDDQHVVWSVLEAHAVQESFDVLDRESVTTLIASILVTLKQSELRTLGVIVDADFDIGKRWASLKNQFQKAGCTIPDHPVQGGFIGRTVTAPVKNVGVWIMPDNTLAGMLEDFTRMLIPDGDQFLEHCEHFLSHLEERNINRYKPMHRAKALIHTWLAGQEDPGTPMGQSITKRYLSTNTEHCRSFVQWINQLFNSV